MKRAGLQYLLTGFTEDTGYRIFAFDGVTNEWVRTAYSVRADLALARRHRIQLQELPLLCRGVLEQRSEDDDRRVFTFTEGDMTAHANLVTAALEAQKNKASRRPFVAAATTSASAVQPA